MLSRSISLWGGGGGGGISQGQKIKQLWRISKNMCKAHLLPSSTAFSLWTPAQTLNRLFLLFFWKERRGVWLPGGTQTFGKVWRWAALFVSRIFPSADSRMMATPVLMPRDSVDSGSSAASVLLRLFTGQNDGCYGNRENTAIYTPTPPFLPPSSPQQEPIMSV